VRAYWAIVSARFRMLLQYRAAAAAGFGTQLFWGLVRIMILEAFYRSTTAKQPMSLEQAIDYIWLGQAMLMMLPAWLDIEVTAMIRSGTVVYELLRPLDLYSLWFSRAVAARTAPTVLRAVPMFIAAGLFFGLRAPASPASAAAWLLAVLGALLLTCAISTLLTISLLWTISGEGIFQLTNTCMWIFSGMLVPLPLFPDWAQGALNVLPFRGLMDIPARLYSGNLSPGVAGALFLHQVLWAAGLILIGRLLLARGARRLVVQGG